MKATATRSRQPNPPMAKRATSAPAIAAAITPGARLARNSRQAAPIVLTSEPVHADISWPTILRAPARERRISWRPWRRCGASVPPVSDQMTPEGYQALKAELAELEGPARRE